jgi:predicted Zn-dependent protease
MKRILVTLLLLASVILNAQDDAVVRAMKDEMARSTKKLELEQMGKPYFISYRVVDGESKTATGEFGSLLSSSEGRSRFLSVEVRVGDYALDNTHFFSMPFGGTGVVRQMFSGNVQLPLDDNYDEIRRQIWLATDGAYKKALEDFAGKRAALQNKQRTETVADFSKETPVTLTDSAPEATIDLKDAEKLTRDLSAIFRQYPGVQTSQVYFSVDNRLERFMSTEGASFVRRSPIVLLRATASTQAPNGMPLRDNVHYFTRSTKELPPNASIVADVKAMGDRLQKLQAAPLAGQYNGPVLFEGEAACGLLARFFAHQILAQPSVLSDNPQIAQGISTQQPVGLLNKLGGRVLPDFISIVDDPTQSQAEGRSLMGGYKVDEEGIAPHATVVVKDGILKTLLASRSPVRGVPQSSGNMREHGVAPSNLYLAASKTSTPEELKARLLELAKSRGNEYGIVIRRLDLRDMRQAYRVYPDGHEELIRNGELAGVNVSTFKDLLAVSNNRVVFTEPFLQGAGAGIGQMLNFNPFEREQTIVSYVVPSLLFEDVSVQPPHGQIQRVPVLPHPFFAK